MKDYAQKFVDMDFENRFYSVRMHIFFITIITYFLFTFTWLLTHINNLQSQTFNPLPILLVSIVFLLLGIFIYKRGFNYTLMSIVTFIFQCLFILSAYLNGYIVLTSLLLTVISLYSLLPHKIARFFFAMLMISASLVFIKHVVTLDFWLFSRFILIPLMLGILLDHWSSENFNLEERTMRQLVVLVCSLYMIFSVAILMLVLYGIAPGQVHVYIFMFVATLLVAISNRRKFNIFSLGVFLAIMCLLQIFASAKTPYIGLIYSGGLICVVSIFASRVVSILTAIGFFTFNIYVYLPAHLPVDIISLRAIIVSLMAFIIITAFVSAIRVHAKSMDQSFSNLLPSKIWIYQFFKNSLFLITFLIFVALIPFIHDGLAYVGGLELESMVNSDVVWLWFTIAILLIMLISAMYTSTVVTTDYMYELIEKVKDVETKKLAFLNNMSHEMRTPLNGILGMCEVLLLQNQFPELKKPLTIIKFSGNRLMRLVDDSIDLTLIEKDQFKIIEKKFSPFQLLNSTVANIDITIKPSVEFKVNNNLNPSLYLIGDAGRISQILENLITNALKYTERGVVIVNLNYRINQLLIDVEDTGVGIRADGLEKMFVPMQQGDLSHEQLQQGIGIGLSIIKQLVDKMQGKISVASQPNVGTHFSISLPLLKAQ